MQSIYGKEATEVENPKTQTLFWCRKPTSQYGTANHLISCIAYRAVSVNLRNSGLPFTVVPCLHQCNLYMERKLRRWRTQKCKPCFGAESPLRSTGLQTTGFHASRMVTSVYICETRGYLSPWYRVCTNAIYICKGSYGGGEPKNLNLVLVQKAHFAVRDCKPPNFMHRV